MSNEKTELSEREIHELIGDQSYISSAQRDLFRAVFEIRRDMSKSQTHDVLKRLVETRLLPESTVDNVFKKLFP